MLKFFTLIRIQQRFSRWVELKPLFVRKSWSQSALKSVFFIETTTQTTAGRYRKLKTTLGTIQITERQAQKLKVKPHTQISEYLDICSLLVSANNSYSRSEEDFEILTGIHLSHSTHQRLVHRQEFEEIICETPVEVICIDGGEARIRTIS